MKKNNLKYLSKYKTLTKIMKLERFLDKIYLKRLIFNNNTIKNIHNIYKLTDYDIRQCELCEPEDRKITKNTVSIKNKIK